MRKWYVALGLALCSGSALAADFGVGVSARSNDGILYAPIDISNSLRLEPSVRYGRTSRDEDGVYAVDQETRELEIGFGVFGLKQIGEAVRFYYGARLAYVANESDDFYFAPSTDSRRQTELDGYRIGPTVGFEYLFGQRFSVGGEASYSFVDLDGKTVQTTTTIFGSTTRTEADIARESSGSQTRLIFRYMF